MNPGRESLLDLVVAFVRQIPAATIESVVAELAAQTDWTQTPLLMSCCSPTPRWSTLWRHAASEGVAPARLAGMLSGAVAMEAEWRRRGSCEVAWTGPTPSLSHLRRTEQALLEVVGAAKRELWVVSFAAYRVGSICEALVTAAQRGCSVRLLLESETESAGKLTSGGLDGMPDDVRSCCELFVWPREKRITDERGRFGSLHAKCAVADGELLFVGSSNLTEFAFELNIELGLLVRGTDAARIVEGQLRWLVVSGTICRV